MNLLRYLLPLVAVMGFASSAAFAADPDAESRFDRELNERDFDALREYLKNRRILEAEEKPNDSLVITGDVRTEWRNLVERQDGVNLRGGRNVNKSGVPISRNDFDIEFNIRFDYTCNRAWAVAHLQFDNSAGIDSADCICGDSYEKLVKNHKKAYVNPWQAGGSGHCDDLCLKRAYIGYNVYSDACTRFDVELGRRRLYDIFDSKSQFLSRFDGLLLRFTGSWECIADWYYKLGGFVVDEKVNYFAWATEVGFMNIFDSGFDLKYSYIDWVKNGRNRCGFRDPLGSKFRVSQWTGYYHFNPDIIHQPAYVYAAFLYNHAARRTILTHYRKENVAWYAGFRIGEVDKEGDWAFEMMYQLVQAQAVPDFDVSGIDRGNVMDDCFTSAIFIPTEDGGYYIFPRRGNTNFKGWRFEALYALTDNLTLNPQLEWDNAEDKNIGGKHYFSKFELEVIYAF